MKKFLALILALAMVLSLAACGGKSEAPAAEAPAADGAILAGKTVGFAQTDSMSSWRTTETDSIKASVEAAGGTFVVKDAQGDIATQASDVADLIALGVDYLVVAPLEDNGLQDVLVEAMEAGIPVILVDRAIAGEATSRQVLTTP